MAGRLLLNVANPLKPCKSENSSSQSFKRSKPPGRDPRKSASRSTLTIMSSGLELKLSVRKSPLMTPRFRHPESRRTEGTPSALISPCRLDRGAISLTAPDPSGKCGVPVALSKSAKLTLSGGPANTLNLAGRQASCLSWSTGFQPVVSCADRRDALSSLTGGTPVVRSKSAKPPVSGGPASHAPRGEG